MQKVNHDERNMRLYLLGYLEAAEQQELEARLLTDDHYFSELLLVEDELIDDYVSGKLTFKEKSRFSSHFLCTKERKEKVGFARALEHYVSQNIYSNPVESNKPLHQRPAWPALNPLLGWSLVSALLVVSLAGVWSLGKVQGLESAMTEIRDYSKENILYQKDKSEQLVRLLQDAHTRSQMLQNRLNSLNGQAGSTADQPSYLLRPGAFRDFGETTPRVNIPQNQPSVELELDLAIDHYQSFRAELLDADGEQLVSFYKLRAQVSEDRSFVRLFLPAGILAHGDYSLRLSGLNVGQQTEVISQYNFRVIP